MTSSEGIPTAEQVELAERLRRLVQASRATADVTLQTVLQTRRLVEKSRRSADEARQTAQTSRQGRTARPDVEGSVG